MAKSLANDAVVRQAVIEEILASGVDRVGPTAVARRAGFTTGAVYGRYENSIEMVIDTWLEELWPRYAGLLDRIVDAVVDGGAATTSDLEVVLAEMVDAPPWLSAATEVLAVAHRSEELTEVIGPQVTGWLDRWNAGPDGPPPRRASVLLVVGAVVGSIIGDLAGLPTEGRVTMFDWARLAAAADPVDLPPLEPLDVGELVVDTGDPVRDSLLGACIEVIADVGFERATASRIARRAGVGTNWVYADHDTKQELLVDAVDVLLDSLVTPAAVEDLASGRGRSTPMGAASLAIGAFVHPARRTVRLTRLEALLCARHHPAVIEVLVGMWSDLFDSHIEAVGLAAPGLAEASRPVLLYLAAELSGLTVIDALAGPLTDVDWRYGLLPFEGVVVAAWGDAATPADGPEALL